MGMDCCDGKVFDPVGQCCVATGLLGGSEILPKVPVDLDKCYNRVQNPDELDFAHSTDGCSVIGNNPAGCPFTAFATGDANNPLGCDFHDFCYRSCNSAPGARTNCDTNLRDRLFAICNGLTPDQFAAPA